MITEIKHNTLKKLLKKRDKNSHKGDNGRLLIIGGSIEYYAPPVLAAMAAQRVGVDLVSLFVPEVNFDVTRGHLKDAIVRRYPGEYLSERYVEQILKYAKKNVNAVLIGPGLSGREKTLISVLDILRELKLPTVLDASAISVLKRIKKFPLDQEIVITPHGNEFKSLVDKDMNVDMNDSKSMIFLRSIAMDLGINILLKGPVDYVASSEGVIEFNKTGNSGMTVGGTGDVLAGAVAGFLAQGYGAYQASRLGAYFVGKAGDRLKRRMGNSFLASEVADELYKVIK